MGGGEKLSRGLEVLQRTESGELVRRTGCLQGLEEAWGAVD